MAGNDALYQCMSHTHVPVGGIAVGSAYFGFGSGDIVFDDVQCTGSEMTLLECPASTDNNCFHNEDAGVVCGTFCCYVILLLLANDMNSQEK